MTPESRHRILIPGETCDGLYPTAGARLLVDVRDYYRAFHRAASEARSFIFIAGWQFDSDVALLRGDDVSSGSGDLLLLPFLRSLCERNRELVVLLLAWDFSPIFALEREWFQEWVFRWGGGGRIEFRFDDTHAIGGSHHQKFAVIDGNLAFAGGADICSNRWDDRAHLPVNPLRTGTDGSPYGPYHDVHCYLSGEVARRLTDLFLERWEVSGGTVPDVGYPFYPPPRIDIGLPLPATVTAVSRTVPRTLAAPGHSVLEIRNLYTQAVAAAESFIYLENQYFSSHAVSAALVRRLSDPARSRLDVVVVLPKKPEALREEVTLGAAQMKMLEILAAAAAAHGHRFGVYYVAPHSGSGDEVPVYIHSKLLIVDDRFLTVGSANTTNRSLGLDTELNVSWEGEPSERRVVRAIRGIRVSLLAEHAGLLSFHWRLRLRRTKGLVPLLDWIAAMERSRLHRHSLDTVYAGREWLKEVAPDRPLFDPEDTLEETLFEVIPPDRVEFLRELVRIDAWAADKTRDDAGASLVQSAPGRETEEETVRRTLLFWGMMLVVSVLVLALLLFAAWLFPPLPHVFLPSPR